ncbi:MAG: MBL fold metallo-hydrolase [Candidatus Vogelbacteria bacterium]|nr:MBL fold metallo-hydrolase [Candidatus Vogelbacteria bacterium]
MAEPSKLTITFCGGAGAVTGANFLIEFGGGKYLVDCGLFQGTRIAEEQNHQKFPYDPANVEALFVTHAHLDHVGRIPQLVRGGFRGKIYSTPPTKEIAALSLVDSLGVLEKEARTTHLPLLYSEADVKQALSLWATAPYHEAIKLGHFSVMMKDAGHILGSAMFEFTINNTKIIFTGDLGNSPAPLLPDTEPISDADYLIMESVYGDRNHEDRRARRELLEDVIENTMKRGGTLVIPAFSIERTQEMLYEIENMTEQSRIPLVPVFIDSPLAIAVTEVYYRYRAYLKREVTDLSLHQGQIFNFPQLRRTVSTLESKAIAHFPNRKIIIAGSGMSNGGRVIHHEKRYLPGPDNVLLLVGYQAPGSLGRQLQDGAKLVRILDEEVPVRAKVVSISGYSAHKGADDLLNFVSSSAESLKKVFVVMGEPRASLYLAQRIRDYLGVTAVVPQAGERAEIILN